MLYDDGIEFAENMRQQGNAVELYVEPYANHDIFYLGATTCFKAEGVKGRQSGWEISKSSRRQMMGFRMSKRLTPQIANERTAREMSSSEDEVLVEWFLIFYD